MTTAPGPEERAAVRAQLERSAGPVPFADLRPHLARDAVFVVAPGVSLLDCAVAIAMNDVTSIQQLLATRALARPSAAEQQAWGGDEERRWTAAVVQPFVLVQDAR